MHWFSTTMYQNIRSTKHSTSSLLRWTQCQVLRTTHRDISSKHTKLHNTIPVLPFTLSTMQAQKLLQLLISNFSPYAFIDCNFFYWLIHSFSMPTNFSNKRLCSCCFYCTCRFLSWHCLSKFDTKHKLWNLTFLLFDDMLCWRRLCLNCWLTARSRKQMVRMTVRNVQ